MNHLSINFSKKISPGTYNKRMCIKVVEVHRVIEPEHSNWMRPYIMLSISLRATARNESGTEKDVFKLISIKLISF